MPANVSYLPPMSAARLLIAAARTKSSFFHVIPTSSSFPGISHQIYQGNLLAVPGHIQNIIGFHAAPHDWNIDGKETRA